MYDVRSPREDGSEMGDEGPAPYSVYPIMSQLKSVCCIHEPVGVGE
jgi:hypothetical protein